jgi:two-component system OmpR family sensor kinase
MSMRLRLLLAISGFVLVGLLIAGLATYVLLRSFLLDRVDAQLYAAQGPVVQQLKEGGMPPPGGSPDGTTDQLLPPGTMGEALQNGQLIAQPVWLLDQGQGHPPAPVLPTPIGATPSGRIFTTGAQGAPSFHYRVLARSFSNGAVLVVAIPLTDVGDVLNRLLTVEALVAAGVLLGLVALSLWTVRRELRPLERIEQTAGAIAAGDLSRRVDVVDPRTEVGRLGLSLNAMLAQIERAFDERRASESRLRRFLADASHELRTPLTSIRGYAELFRRGAGARPEDLATSMRRIEEEAARMGVMVDDLLLLARLDQGRPMELAPVDLAAIAADAVADARTVNGGRHISVHAPDRLEVSGDEARLREVVANLLSNALEYTDGAIDVSVRPEDGSATLEVADHGPGLSEEQRAQVFEPFYRADPARTRRKGGAGLGLSIVSSILEAHGGTIAIVETDGGGATFRVSLPAVRMSPAVPTPNGSGVAPAPDEERASGQA